MTIKHRTSSCSSATSRASTEHQRNMRSAMALKRYLDLTLRGTRKNLADHGCKAKKGHPLSPYTFDQPDIEKSVQRVLQTPDNSERAGKPPGWVNEINRRIIKHSGEAPIFTENFLPSSKGKQVHMSQGPHSRPLSGISTKSAPIIINGEMYYRQSKKHTYLQASKRPVSAKQERLTRAAKLRNKHRSQAMSGVPFDSTKDELRRIKDSKPLKQNLNNDLLPIPCHTNETPHSFIIGARYNCSHFMDSRSFSRLGLYVPRQNPLGTFLKSYKGEEEILDNGSESEAFIGHTSVRTGGSSRKLRGSSTQPLGNYNERVHPSRQREEVQPRSRVRKVVKEAWLNTPDENTRLPGKSRNTNDRVTRTGSLASSPVPPHPSPKLVGPKVHKQPATQKSGRKSQRARSSPAMHSNDFDLAAVMPTSRANMLKDLHLPKQSQLRSTKSSQSYRKSRKQVPQRQIDAEQC